jgi:hypothetical protein
MGLVNEEFKSVLPKKLVLGDLPQHPRILRRIESYIEANPLNDGAHFNHYRPARYFSEKLDSLAGNLSAETLDRFEKAFKALNALLPEKPQE